MLTITDLRAAVGERRILHGVDLDVGPGEVHAIMGPNGSGKSTLAHVLAGRDGYQVTGTVAFRGQDLLGLMPEERAALGLFLAFQHPTEIPGVGNLYFLRAACNAIRRQRGREDLGAAEFLALAEETMALVGMDRSFMSRSVNEGFSGGEKKRNEILQMSLLRPRIAILDEIDSGLDIDAIKVVADGVNDLRSEDFGAVIITHYQRILNYVSPTHVHVMMQGRIVRSGGPELALELEARGYDWLRQELGLEDNVPQEA